MAKKNPLMREFWTICGNFKIFEKLPYPVVKFDQQFSRDVGEPVWPTILELYPNFVRKLGPEQPEIVSA